MCARHVLVESKVSVTSPRSSLLQPAARLLRKPLEGRTHRHVRGSVSTPCRSTRSCERPVAEAAGLGRLQALDDLPVSFYIQKCVSPIKKLTVQKVGGKVTVHRCSVGGKRGTWLRRVPNALVSLSSRSNRIAMRSRIFRSEPGPIGEPAMPNAFSIQPRALVPFISKNVVREALSSQGRAHFSCLLVKPEHYDRVVHSIGPAA